VAIRARTAPDQNLQLLSAWNQARLASLLQTTWALVLRCYTNSEDICFGYQHLGVDGSQQPTDPANATAIQLAIDAGDSIREVVGKAGHCGSTGVLSETREDVSGLFNTTLLLRTYCDSANKRRSVCTQPVLATMLPDEAS
jgi:hypothetical protein